MCAYIIICMFECVSSTLIFMQHIYTYYSSKYVFTNNILYISDFTLGLNQFEIDKVIVFKLHTVVINVIIHRRQVSGRFIIVTVWRELLHNVVIYSLLSLR